MAQILYLSTWFVTGLSTFNGPFIIWNPFIHFMSNKCNPPYIMPHVISSNAPSEVLGFVSSIDHFYSSPLSIIYHSYHWFGLWWQTPWNPKGSSSLFDHANDRPTAWAPSHFISLHPLLFVSSRRVLDHLLSFLTLDAQVWEKQSGRGIRIAMPELLLVL